MTWPPRVSIGVCPRRSTLLNTCPIRSLSCSLRTCRIAHAFRRSRIARCASSLIPVQAANCACPLFERRAGLRRRGPARRCGLFTGLRVAIAIRLCMWWFQSRGSAPILSRIAYSRLRSQQECFIRTQTIPIAILPRRRFPEGGRPKEKPSSIRAGGLFSKTTYALMVRFGLCPTKP